jgi:Leucine-rich repeat (LRR) protein
MKNLVFIFALVLISTCTDAQNTLLDSASLAKEPVFYSLEEALQTPLKVYKLDLSWNKLTALPKEIGKLKNLAIFGFKEKSHL